MAVSLSISTIGGSQWVVQADRGAPVRAAKVALEKVSRIPWREQRLVCGTTELRDKETLGKFLQSDESIATLTLLRRDPEKAAWLEKVDKSWLKLQDAPAEVLDDADIILAALGQDDKALWLASPDLMSDEDFVRAAVRQRGWPEGEALAVGLRSDISRYLRTTADAKLALQCAANLRLDDVAEVISSAHIVEVAPVEERIGLVSGFARASTTGESLRGLLQHVACEDIGKAMSKSVLCNLRAALLLLDLEREAHPTSSWGKMATGARNLFGDFRGIFGGSAKKVSDIAAVSSGPVLSRDDFAVALFKEHADTFLGAAGASEDLPLLFKRLLAHVESALPRPDSELCCRLVRASLIYEPGEKAQDIFSKVADGSEACGELLTEAQLPLTVLEAHPDRAALLSSVIGKWGGDRVVEEAVTSNRQALRGLLTAIERRGDAVLGRLPVLCSALHAAAQRDGQAGAAAAAGARELPVAIHIMFRAYVSPSPPRLPDFPVPLTWLRALRGLQGCAPLAIERLLGELERIPSDAEASELTRNLWGAIDWPAASGEQAARAIRALRRWGREGALQAADLSGREREERRLDLDQRLGDALLELPLDRLPDSRILVAPELPMHGVLVSAWEKLRQVERKMERQQTELKDAKERAETANRRADEAHAHSRRVEDELRSLRCRVDSLARPTS